MRYGRSSLLALVAAAALLGCTDLNESAVEQRVRLKLELGGVESIYLETTGDAHYYVVTSSDGSVARLTPDEFAARTLNAHVDRPRWQRILNITSSVGIAWVVLGFTGQLLFTGRMVVQWFVSEKQKRSTVPVIFWWMSLAGASMLLIYFVWRKDIVGVLGQLTGWAIYLRNLVLIYRARSI